MATVTFNIDGRDITVGKGTTILEAALNNGIYIPHLCYRPDLMPHSTCRLCQVELGDGELVTSCRIPAEPGMKVLTKSPAVDGAVRPIVELIIVNNHITCRGCLSSGQCELQKIMAHLRIDRKRLERLRLPAEPQPKDTSNPFFDYDLNKCVLCCVMPVPYTIAAGPLVA